MTENRELAGAEIIWSLADYGDSAVAASIRHFKYDFITDLLVEFWQPALLDFWRQKQDYFQADKWLLVPVPLHWRKELRRGFNQSQLIAESLKRISGYPIGSDLLIRIKNNPPQAKKAGLARQASVKGIFKINYRRLSDYWGHKILLIDDVATTGSTLKECIGILQKAGFTDLSALVLAS